MRDRIPQVLRIACLALAALLVYRIVTDVFRGNPLARVTVPPLPSLPGDTNAPAPAVTRATNAVATTDTSPKGTNAHAAIATNAASTKVESNAVVSVGITNSGAGPAPVVVVAAGSKEAPLVKNDSPKTGVVEPAKSGTNAVAGMASGKTDTNAAARVAQRSSPSGASGSAKKTDLPPAVKARVDRIYDSEIFGPVTRPLPMALLGIAGNTAFLRSPSGQTGLAKEGERVGELTLVRIGINRVLVEQEGEKKELMIFSGYGGDSLLPKQQEGSK